jgi:hypothetical protein
MEQSHENFDLRIVIDSRNDPAWDVVNPFLQEFADPRIQTRILSSRLPSCSLKVNAVLQETQDLTGYDAVVMIDADAVPYQHWLRDMLRPLLDPTVGTCTGIRWFAPAQTSLANLVRVFWGAIASVQMYALGMPWGGCLALKTKFIQNSSIRDRWTRSFSEDQSTSYCLPECGMKPAYAPAIMINEESIDLSGCFQFFRRQMIAVRLCSPMWSKIAGFTLLAMSGIVLLYSVAIWALLTGSWGILAVAFLAPWSLGFPTRLTLLWADRQVRTRVAEQERDVQPLRGRQGLALTLTFFINVAVLVSAVSLRRFVWRGIIYRITPERQIRIIKDVPYLAPRQMAKASVM